MKKKIKFDHEKERKIENIDTMIDSNLCNIIDKETEFKEKSQHEIEFSEWPRITNEIKESVEMIAKKPAILKNGLISDYKFYMKELLYKNAEGKDEVKPYTVGKYKRKPITSLRGTTDLFSSEYQSLSPKVYLSGDVIDISAIIFEKTWKKATFIPTAISFYLFRDQWNPNYDWPMFHLVVAPTTKYILIPYVRDLHYRLFLIDMEKNFVTLIDPIRREPSDLEDKAKRVYNCFLRYLHYCTDNKIENSFMRNKLHGKWYGL